MIPHPVAGGASGERTYKIIDDWCSVSAPNTPSNAPGGGIHDENAIRLRIEEFDDGTFLLAMTFGGEVGRSGRGLKRLLEAFGGSQKVGEALWKLGEDEAKAKSKCTMFQLIQHSAKHDRSLMRLMVGNMALSDEKGLVIDCSDVLRNWSHGQDERLGYFGHPRYMMNLQLLDGDDRADGDVEFKFRRRASVENKFQGCASVEENTAYDSSAPDFESSHAVTADVKGLLKLNGVELWSDWHKFKVGEFEKAALCDRVRLRLPCERLKELFGEEGATRDAERIRERERDGNIVGDEKIRETAKEEGLSSQEGSVAYSKEQRRDLYANLSTDTWACSWAPGEVKTIARNLVGEDPHIKEVRMRAEHVIIHYRQLGIDAFFFGFVAPHTIAVIAGGDGATLSRWIELIAEAGANGGVRKPWIEVVRRDDEGSQRDPEVFIVHDENSEEQCAKLRRPKIWVFRNRENDKRVGSAAESQSKLHGEDHFERRAKRMYEGLPTSENAVMIGFTNDRYIVMKTWGNDQYKQQAIQLGYLVLGKM